MPFRNLVSTEQGLRAILGEPSELVKRKAIPQIDSHCREFIARSPFLLLATANGAGECDVSPRGDAPGFVQVLSDGHLAIPERPGNRRIDSLRNILSNPRVGLLFVIPGLEETLRVNGQACILQDPDLLGSMEAHGKRPLLAIGVAVEECYVHCAKAFKRSRLWEPGSWPEQESLPSIPQMVADHARVEGLGPDEVARALQESYRKRLY